MKQDAFEAAHESAWREYEQMIGLLSGQDAAYNSALRSKLADSFPARYREICHHLALARARRYSIALEQRLNQLALEGHQHLYRNRMTIFASAGRFLFIDFPATFRACWRYMVTSAAAFYLPAIGMAVALSLRPELIYSLIEPLQVSRIEEMYDPANNVLGRARESDTDIYMFGYYIYNNIGIGFRTFAGGLLFGVGSLFFLLFNGLFLGAVATHLTAIGYTDTFWPFVAGHSAFELTAIVIFGGVGLMIGHGAIAPGRKQRWHAIRDRATGGLPLIYGGTLMLVAAAFVEAFWSSTTWPPASFKYAVGGTAWCALLYYFIFAGRRIGS